METSRVESSRAKSSEWKRGMHIFPCRGSTSQHLAHSLSSCGGDSADIDRCQSLAHLTEALQEKVESLQRQLQCAEKKLLSKELEREERDNVWYPVSLQLSWRRCEFTVVALPIPVYVWDRRWRQRCHKRAYNLAQADLSLLRWRHHTRIKNAKLRSLAFEESETYSEWLVTMVHQEYEEKIKGLMPADLRQELEDTITSLKAQVGFLRKTASLLQEDLDACRSRR
ncbi:hypothetical protein CHARACLAT_012971 [Characodon lateralis]|uniref:Uncharacterized protein n=1 Tax=Characodon lateralis TaxID=208331 RepID=A0ABU7ELB9_9TELE|nr:hypothetical protein [Characodon lateralis]